MDAAIISAADFARFLRGCHFWPPVPPLSPTHSSRFRRKGRGLRKQSGWITRPI